MIIVLWILNGLLALAFLAAGGMKLVKSRQAIADGGMAWAHDSTNTRVKLIGLAEVFGALGLILPLSTGIAPALTPVAAIALAALMVGASLVHIRRHEPPMPAAVLAVLAALSAVLGFLHLS